MVPLAIIIAATGILVEVAIHLARSVVLARNAAIVAVFGVVTGAKAIGVERIDQPIRVVVEKVSAFVHMSLTLRDDLTAAGTGSGCRSGGVEATHGARAHCGVSVRASTTCALRRCAGPRTGAVASIISTRKHNSQSHQAELQLSHASIESHLN